MREPRRAPPQGRGRYVALSGTPGTGKSAIAVALQGSRPAIEVFQLALHAGAALGRGRRTVVDLGRLSRWIRAHSRPERTTLLVGHLAHLLPVQEVVLLRCHPLTVEARLHRAHRGGARERSQNVVAEAIDLLLAESLALGRTVRELDTSREGPASLAARIDRWIARPLRPRFGTVDWLADPRVTDFLFHRARYPAPWSSRATGRGRRLGSSALRGPSSAGRRTG